MVNEKIVTVERHGGLVLLRLPPPGKWVVAMMPSTARDLAAILAQKSVGNHIAGGIKVSFTKLVMPQIVEALWCLQFDDWPGTLALYPEGLHRLERLLITASERREEVSIASCGDAREYSIG